MPTQSIFTLLKGYIILTRPLGSVLVGLATIIGQTVALKSLPDLSLLIFPVLASVSLTSASFVINDYLDVEIDRINKPNKPLPSGIISKKAALSFGLALTIVGFSFVFLTNFLASMILIFAYFFSVFYSTHLKVRGLLGNIAIAFCVSAVLLFGALSATNSINFATFLLFALCFFSNLGREITQSITDAEGDKKKGLRTVAVVYGPRFAATLASIFYALTLFFGPVAFLCIFNNLEVSILVIVIILIPEVGFVISMFSLLRDNSTDKVAKSLKNINLWMFLFLVATALAASL